MTKRANDNRFFQSLRIRKIAAGVAMLAIFVTVLSLVLFEGTKKNITLDADGKTIELKTHAATVEDALAQHDIEIGSYDAVSPSADSSITDGMAIDWVQANPVSINMNNDSTTIWTTESSVENVLADAGVEVTDHDLVEPSLDSEVGADSEITIDKAFQITLKDGKKSTKVWSTSTTIADFLKNENIKLSELDRIESDKEQLLMPKSVVSIVRVEKTSDVVEETTNFDVKKRSDENLLKGREEVVNEGEKGKVRKRFEIVKENGKEVSRKLIAQHVVAHPKPKVVSVGSKVQVASADVSSEVKQSAPQTAVTPAPKNAPELASVTKSKTETAPVSESKTETETEKVPVAKSETESAPAPESASTASSTPKKSVSRDNGSEPGKVMYMNATAYTAECTGCSGITATGINLNANRNLKVIAVDPGVIPLGSKVWVEGYGYAVAGDTGGDIKGNRIDLHVATDGAAKQFGRRQVQIKVLN